MRGSSKLNVCRLSFDGSDSDSDTGSITSNDGTAPHMCTNGEPEEAAGMEVEEDEETAVAFDDNEANLLGLRMPSQRVGRVLQSAPHHSKKRPVNTVARGERQEASPDILAHTPTKALPHSAGPKVRALPVPDFSLLAEESCGETAPMKRDDSSPNATPQLVRTTHTPAKRSRCPETPTRSPTFSRLAPQTVEHPKRYFASMAGPQRLKVTPSDLHVLEKVGEGSFGVVYKVRADKTNEVYAMKKSKKFIPFVRTTADSGEGSDSDSDPRAQLREVELAMSVPEHPNVVCTYQAWEEADRHLYILSEFCEQSLSGLLEERWLRKDRAFSETQLLCFAADMLRGVAFLHGLGIMHLDLKPANMLVRQCSVPRAVLKICDFGLAHRVEDGRQQQQQEQEQHAFVAGDNRYMAPELLADMFGFPADVFSLGITLYEMSHPGVVLPTHGDRWKALRSNDIDFGVWEYSRELKELITAMLSSDPSRRPTAPQLAASPFILPYAVK